MSGFGDCATKTDRRHHVLQGAPPPHMHMHIAGSDQRQTVTCAEPLQPRQFGVIVRTVMQFHGKPRTSGKMLRYPLCLIVDHGLVSTRGRSRNP